MSAAQVRQVAQAAWQLENERLAMEVETGGSAGPRLRRLASPDLPGVVERFQYAVRIGGMALMTGDIGSGKSTALKFAAANLHPSEFRLIHLIASSGSILEFYRLLLEQLGVETASASRAYLTRIIKQELCELALVKT